MFWHSHFSQHNSENKLEMFSLISSRSLLSRRLNLSFHRNSSFRSFRSKALMQQRESKIDLNTLILITILILDPSFRSRHYQSAHTIVKTILTFFHFFLQSCHSNLFKSFYANLINIKNCFSNIFDFLRKQKKCLIVPHSIFAM